MIEGTDHSHLRQAVSRYLPGKRPAFLTEYHYPLVHEEIAFMAQFHGRKRRDYNDALHERDILESRSPSAIEKRIRLVLCSLAFKNKKNAIQSMQKLRLKLFFAAQSHFKSGMSLEEARSLALAECSELKNLQPQSFSLFQDLSQERRLNAAALEGSHALVIETVNSRYLKKLLSECTELVVLFDGNAKNVVKLAQLKGLVCNISLNCSGQSDAVDPHQSQEDDRVCASSVEQDVQTSARMPKSLAVFRNVLRVSGPLSLFQQTPIYKTALYSLFSQICYAGRFVAQIVGMHNGEQSVYSIHSGDPLKPGKVPKRFDSRLERRFALDFVPRFPDWELIRDSQAFEIDQGAVIFPDFLLRNRRSNSEFILEIVGYWTEEYFENKVTQYLQLSEIIQKKRERMRIILLIDRRFEDSVAMQRKQLPFLIVYFDKVIALENLAVHLESSPHA